MFLLSELWPEWTVLVNFCVCFDEVHADKFSLMSHSSDDVASLSWSQSIPEKSASLVEIIGINRINIE
jgi:hypothetical protein